MKKIHPLLPALAAGSAGYVLRFLLYRNGFDDRGLLNPADPLHILCWILALGLSVFLLLRLRKNCDAPIAPVFGTLSAVAAALLLAFCTWNFVPDAQGTLQRVRVALCALAAAAIILSALIQATGRTIHPALHVPVCLFFPTDMLCRYQNWSGNPQLADYCFTLGASVCLCLSAYQLVAMPAKLGKRKFHLLFTLLALCLCLFSLAGPESSPLYLAGAFWAVAALSFVHPGEEAARADS